MSVIQNVICKLGNYNTSYQYLWSRRFSPSVFIASPKKTIEEKLGIQRRPKRPLTAFMKYASERRSIIIQQNPNKKLGEIMKILSEEWKNLEITRKNELQANFKKDWSKYLEECKNYDEMLSPGEKEQIKLVKEEVKILQAKKILRKRREELGCPKKPGSSYMYFMKARLPERGDEPFIDFQRKLKKDWEILPPLEKKRFEEMYKKDMEDYREKMTEWNKQMLAKGNKDVVLYDASSKTSSHSENVMTRTLAETDMELNRNEKNVMNDMKHNHRFLDNLVVHLILISSGVAVLSYFIFVF